MRLLITESLFLIILGFIGCTKDNNQKPNDDEPVLPVEFEFNIYNINGEIDSVFDEGENFIISFFMKRIIDTPYFVVWRNFEDNPDFLKVKKIEDDIVTEEYPYKIPGCYKIGWHPPDENGEWRYDYPWIWDSALFEFPHGCRFSVNNAYNHSPLTKGIYFTEFKDTFTFVFYGTPEWGSYTTDTLRFAKEFIIK